MNKSISIVILAVGVLLIVFGISATDSFSSDVSRFFTGSPTNKAIWLLIAGVVVSVIGAMGLGRGSKAA
jgi:uncharacterized membrane protein YidH (DUF202 family)